MYTWLSFCCCRWSSSCAISLSPSQRRPRFRRWVSFRDWSPPWGRRPCSSWWSWTAAPPCVPSAVPPGPCFSPWSCCAGCRDRATMRWSSCARTGFLLRGGWCSPFPPVPCWGPGTTSPDLAALSLFRRWTPWGGSAWCSCCFRSGWPWCFRWACCGSASRSSRIDAGCPASPLSAIPLPSLLPSEDPPPFPPSQTISHRFSALIVCFPSPFHWVQRAVCRFCVWVLRWEQLFPAFRWPILWFSSNWTTCSCWSHFWWQECFSWWECRLRRTE